MTGFNFVVPSCFLLTNPFSPAAPEGGRYGVHTLANKQSSLLPLVTSPIGCEQSAPATVAFTTSPFSPPSKSATCEYVNRAGVSANRIPRNFHT